MNWAQKKLFIISRLRPLLPPPLSTASRPLPDSGGGFERVMPTPGMPTLGVHTSNGPPAFASQQSTPASLGGASGPGSGVGVSAFRAVGSQLAVASPAVRPATSPLPWYFHQLKQGHHVNCSKVSSVKVVFSARGAQKPGEEVGVVEEKASHLHLRQQQGDQDGDAPFQRGY